MIRRISNDLPLEKRFMQSDTQTVPVSKKALWSEHILRAIPVLMLLASGVMKLVKPSFLMKLFDRLGSGESLAVVIGIVELACTVVFLVPRNSVLGAILETGYLGGATATHVRVSDPFFIPIVLGVLVWAGLYLRDARLSAHLPLRT